MVYVVLLEDTLFIVLSDIRSTAKKCHDTITMVALAVALYYPFRDWACN